MKLIVVLFFLWLIASTSFDLNQVYLPNADVFWSILTKEIFNGNLLNNISATFIRVLSGLSVGLVIGVPLGLALGLYERARKEIMPLIEFIRGIPTSMLFPVFIVAFGIGELSKTVIVATTTFPIILVNTVIGCMPRPETQDRRDYITVHAKKLSRYTKALVTVWDALPPIVGGLKVAISISLVLTIVTEMYFVASSGVGWAAHQAYLAFNLELMYCYVIVVGCIGLALNHLFDKSYAHFARVIGDTNR